MWRCRGRLLRRWRTSGFKTFRINYVYRESLVIFVFTDVSTPSDRKSEVKRSERFYKCKRFARVQQKRDCSQRFIRIIERASSVNIVHRARVVPDWKSEKRHDVKTKSRGDKAGILAYNFLRRIFFKVLSTLPTLKMYPSVIFTTRKQNNNWYFRRKKNMKLGRFPEMRIFLISPGC